jgi:hypothetical protein
MNKNVRYHSVSERKSAKHRIRLPQHVPRYMQQTLPTCNAVYTWQIPPMLVIRLSTKPTQYSIFTSGFSHRLSNVVKMPHLVGLKCTVEASHGNLRKGHRRKMSKSIHTDKYKRYFKLASFTLHEFISLSPKAQVCTCWLFRRIQG